MKECYYESYRHLSNLTREFAEFPTTIMIDRYGIISYGQSGAFSSKEEMF